MKNTGILMEKLVNIMDKLLSPDGCPWDKKQTHHTLIPYLIEETYEAVEAIEDNNLEDLKKELGDILLQIVFHSAISKEVFNIDDVIEGISQKLIQRHPHVFGNGKKLNKSEEVLGQWQKLKANENKNNDYLGDIPRHLPSLYQAHRISQRAAAVGFDWRNVNDVIQKVDEEMEELKNEINNNNKNKIEEELGDLLFAISNLSRHLNIDPEVALRKTVLKFRSRFEYIIKKLDNRDPKDCTLDELENLWQESKTNK